MLRWISDFCLLNDLYLCLPIYKAWHLVWSCGYCVQSRKCHVLYNSHSRHAMCAASSRPRVRSVAVTWIKHVVACCLLMSLSAWWALWKNVLERLKHLEIMYWSQIEDQLCTLLMTGGVNIGYCICVSSLIHIFFVWFILYNPPLFSKCTRA